MMRSIRWDNVLPTERCPECGVIYTPELAKREDFILKRRQWLQGSFILDVWPEATPMQREQIQTGLCSDRCWETLMEIDEVDSP